MIIDAHAHIFGHVCRKVAPDEFVDGTFPVERLLALMDREGVDKAVIVQNPTIGTINAEVQAALTAHPDRFAGVIQADPLDEKAPALIERYAASPRQRTIKLEMSKDWGWSGIHPGIRLNGPELRPIFETAAGLRLRVIIDPGCIGGPGYQVEDIDALSTAYPVISFLIEHLGYLEKANCDDSAMRDRRLAMLDLARKPNMYLGFSATAILLDEDYPCRGAVELLKEAVEVAGASKILWGTDVPLTLRRYTYGQMLDVVRREAGFLSNQERRLIVGENAQRLFFQG